MARKIITGLIGCVLLASIALFAAEKAQTKKPAAKKKPQAKAVQEQPKQEGLLDQLIAAYEAKDREKMGEIIEKMEAQRDKTRKIAALNKWHRNEHRKWMRAGTGIGQGWRQMARRGPAFRRSQRWQREIAGWGLRAGDQRPRRMYRWNQQAAGFERSAGWGQPAREDIPLYRWGRQPGEYGAMQDWRPGPRRNAPQNRNMPQGGRQRPKIPPADWGW